MKICVVGAGYVGLANALMLCKNNNITILDVDASKIKKINQRQSPIRDKMIEKYLANDKNKIYATLDKKNAYENSDYVIIAIPTNYNENTQYFDTKSIESVINDIINFNKDAIVIFKSTIPIGYTKYLKTIFNVKDVIFCPEFLREGNALHDNLYPSRIIIGSKGENAHSIAKIFTDSVLQEIPVLFMDSSEAESVKLFLNTYLTMRVGFFDELDTFTKSNKLNTEDVISGVCADPRIGNYYNNPSFGYGGYCLPKDSKQLLSNLKDISNALIQAIVLTNDLRKKFIIREILSKKVDIVGFYRLVMKHGSDNFRNSVMLDLINEIQKYKEIIIYELLVNDRQFSGCKIENNFEKFANKTEMIVANRLDKQLATYRDKVYTNDI